MAINHFFGIKHFAAKHFEAIRSKLRNAIGQQIVAGAWWRPKNEVDEERKKIAANNAATIIAMAVRR